MRLPVNKKAPQASRERLTCQCFGFYTAASLCGALLSCEDEVQLSQMTQLLEPNQSCLKMREGIFLFFYFTNSNCNVLFTQVKLSYDPNINKELPKGLFLIFAVFLL